MDTGCYKKWKPLANLKGHFFCEGIHDDSDSFRILLQIDGRKEIIRLSFDKQFLYRNAEENFRLSAPDSKSQLSFPHPFYIVENSGLLAEFHRQSAHVFEGVPIRHFAIYSCSYCIDVLSVDPPTVEILAGGGN